MKRYLIEERDTLRQAINRIDKIDKFKYTVIKFRNRIASINRILNEKEKL